MIPGRRADDQVPTGLARPPGTGTGEGPAGSVTPVVVRGIRAHDGAEPTPLSGVVRRDHNGPVHLGLILDMSSSGFGHRGAVSGEGYDLSYEELAQRSWAAGAAFQRSGASSVLYVAPNHPAFPVALFGAAAAGIPFVPLNYRLGAEQLLSQARAHGGSWLLPEGGLEVPGALARSERGPFLDDLKGQTTEPPPPGDPESAALLLYTSGTTSAPKAAVLRHRHLMAYLLATVEFGAAGPDEATLISAPPYHIAGVANLLSNLYAGRRIVYLERFDPAQWLETVRRQEVTHAMVIPTMLARIVQHLGDSSTADTPSLRSLSYGGARMPVPVLRRALELFPATDFVNAYGLTETSSTIALLGPEDHRAALASSDPTLQRRLESVGQLVPGVELQVRDEGGGTLPPGQTGLLFLRGEQVSGEYEGSSVLDAEGWFPTRDRGWVDAEGYVFVEGRVDDTIIRGGENIAPAEIEDVLVSHPLVTDAVVVGLPDEEWGQRLAAVVVLDDADLSAEELQAWVRARLRSSKTPESIEVWEELPRTDTGKLLRREVVARLTR
jgi:acyl-CoA synthetase (AMP-forming)/AMP-acid ligase II